MSKLSRGIRTLTRQATLFNAKVISVSGNRATVRLSDNGTIYRSLVVYGGQVTIGQSVKVDMTTDIPFIMAPAAQQSQVKTFKEMKEPRRAYNPPIIIEGMILRYTNNILMASYPFTSTGLDTCFTECTQADLVVLPNGILEYSFTIPTTISFTGQGIGITTIWGTVTLSASNLFTNLTVLDELTSGSGNAVAVIGPDSGEATINYVSGSAFTCGDGNAYGLYQPYGGNSIIDNSKFVGESRNGDGYGVYQEDAP